jgi:hypothetical protein
MLALVVAVLFPWTGSNGSSTVVHPMHTAITEITYEAARRTAAIRIRAFADDFAAALVLDPRAGADSTMSRYVRGTLALVDRTGRPLRLVWIGAEQVGDVLLLHLEVRAPAGLAKARILSAILAERFEDQVNIVRASYDGRTTTLLFTRGEPAKTLP